MADIPNPDEVQEIKQRTFARRVALVVSAYAVILAIGSLGGSNAMKDMLIAQ